MNVVLIGYRGTGKSSVANILERRLGWPVLSTDAEIVARAKRPVPDIVKEFGWDYFRDLESQVCRDVGKSDQRIIDTGGGIILRDDNVSILKANARVFWLTADVSTIQRRIGGDDQRPSLTGTRSFVDEIADVLASRRPRYEAAADFVIPTDNQSLVEVADAIIARL